MDACVHYVYNEFIILFVGSGVQNFLGFGTNIAQFKESVHKIKQATKRISANGDAHYLASSLGNSQLALLFTPFLAVSFIFRDSCRKMFEGLIFAFAMHPFDVGDRVIIDNVHMRVIELNILTSVFHKYYTEEEVITPNSTLTTTSIINLDITPDQSDKAEFYSSNNKVVKLEIGKERRDEDDCVFQIYESKAVHKSKILSMIMKFRKDMEMKIVEIDLARNLKVMLKDIEDPETEIMK
ncbi:hypothetical protein V2J09_016941 [Rumex salicifolius]